MPMRPPHPCAHAGCVALVEVGSYCSIHEPRKMYDERRPAASKRGYGQQHRDEREQQLIEQPLCEHCGREDRVKAASIMDHVVPVRVAPELQHEPENWQSLCKDCHGTKTLRENGLIPCAHLMPVTVKGRRVCAHCGAWL